MRAPRLASSRRSCPALCPLLAIPWPVRLLSLLQNVFSYNKCVLLLQMCSLTTECVLLLQTVFSYYRMRFLTRLCSLPVESVLLGIHASYSHGQDDFCGRVLCLRVRCKHFSCVSVCVLCANELRACIYARVLCVCARVGCV